MAIPDTSYAEVERIVRKFKALSPFARGAYNEDNIRRIDFDISAEKRQHDTIVVLVEEMLQLQKEYADAERNLDDRRHALKRRIDEVDTTIDRIVYQLYGLTEEEIRIVEGAHP
jgi:hypothetical protein